MTLLVMQLELKKWLPRPLLWGLWSLGFTLISIFFYRLCVDYLHFSHHAMSQHLTAPSLFPEVIKPLASWSIVLLSLFIPLLTTSTFSQEYRQQTFVLWANSPFSSRTIVLGKFFCLLLFPVSLILAECLMLAVLGWETTLKISWLFSGALSILLISANIIALGLFISSLCATPLAAMTLTFVATVAWMLLEWLNPFPKNWGGFAPHLSLLNHSHLLLNGILSSIDLAFYILSCLFWLSLTEHVIRRKLKNA